MRGILYFLAVTLIVGWTIIFLGGFITGNAIHIILIGAVILVLVDLLGRGRPRE